MEAKQRELGSRTWAAQFQQNPTPAEGNMIKTSWLARRFAPRLLKSLKGALGAPAWPWSRGHCL
jgi:hypothetical protein